GRRADRPRRAVRALRQRCADRQERHPARPGAESGSGHRLVQGPRRQLPVRDPKQQLREATLTKDIRGLKGQIVTLQLLPDAPGAPVVTGRVLGTIEAADGLMVTIEPSGAPGKRLTVPEHHIVSATPA